MGEVWGCICRLGLLAWGEGNTQELLHTVHGGAPWPGQQLPLLSTSVGTGFGGLSMGTQYPLGAAGSPKLSSSQGPLTGLLGGMSAHPHPHPLLLALGVQPAEPFGQFWSMASVPTWLAHDTRPGGARGGGSGHSCSPWECVREVRPFQLEVRLGVLEN